jgi:hypothetical protein
LNRIHVLVASVIVGLSAIFGLAATTKTVGIGESKPAVSRVSDRVIAARKRKLKRAQVALRKARTKKPPPLPSVPQRPAAAPPRTQLVAQPAPAASAPSSPSFSDDDDHDEDEDEHEDEDDHEEDDDD